MWSTLVRNSGSYAVVTTAITAVTALLATGTLLPFLPWAHGLLRTCDFPRIQIASIAAILIPITLLLYPRQSWGIVLIVVQGAIVVLQALHCWRFTPFHSVQSLDHKGDLGEKNSIRVLSANVKMSNRRFEALVDLVTETRPDILVAMEVDLAWLEGLQPLRKEWIHSVDWPSDNTYGMVILSKLPLVEPELRFLVFDVVPSVRTGVRLRNGQLIRLYAVHPEPPIPHVDTIGRDSELIKIANEVRSDPLPAIVAGDLNDVAWSRTTGRFQRLSGLLDPRVGRGFFNTFDARIPFLRWPLDHVFHDARFRLVTIERLRHIGSDHFPLIFELALHETKRAESAPGQAEAQDRHEAHDVVVQSKDLDRQPVGSDWENS